MDVRRRIYAGIARQLGHPAGLAGRFVGVALNVGDRKHVTAAVDALSTPPGGVVADVGFGGGVGIALLLDRVGAGGKVHGVDISSEMLRRAARRFREEISAGRLELHRASMTDLPFGPASLDGIITANTIYFVSDLDRAFGEFASALKSSGQAVIGLGDPEAMGKLPFAPSHEKRDRSIRSPRSRSGSKASGGWTARAVVHTLAELRAKLTSQQLLATAPTRSGNQHRSSGEDY